MEERLVSPDLGSFNRKVQSMDVFLSVQVKPYFQGR